MNRWSRYHDRCKGCSTTEVRCKGWGLCVRCYDKRFRERPEQKIKNRLKWLRYYAKRKLDPSYGPRKQAYSTMWRKTSTTYRAFNHKRAVRYRIENFLKGKSRLSKKVRYVQIVGPTGGVIDTYIPARELKHRMGELEQLKQKINDHRKL